MYLSNVGGKAINICFDRTPWVSSKFENLSVEAQDVVLLLLAMFNPDERWVRLAGYGSANFPVDGPPYYVILNGRFYKEKT